ncbi:alpha-mannosidase [Acidobacteriota bacterium]
MIESERKLYEVRVNKFLILLKSLIHEGESPLEGEYCVYDPMVGFDERTSGTFNPIKNGEVWGKDWERAWFHLEGTVPKDWKGKAVCARIDLGGEALIFDPSGSPVQGLSVHTIWQNPEFERKRFEITPDASGGERVDLWIEASAAELFGLELSVDEGLNAPPTYGRHQAVVKEKHLSRFRRDIWDLYQDVFILYDLMGSLPLKSVRRSRILRTLLKAVDGFTGTEGNVPAVREILRAELDKKCSPSDLNTLAVGHAHIDTAWLWPVSETIRKCGRTFANQIALLDKYPDYIFGASQALHYEFVKESYPDLFIKIKEKVKQGRWEVQGGMWVEADCNVISGESLVRQILHGKNFFRKEFDIDVKNLWLPDVFGYSAALPQIIKKMGMDYFITQKISWNQFNRFPFHTFQWRGLDGTEVITHFPPEDNYNSMLNPAEMRRAQDNFEEKAFLNEFLTLFGVGDGGGGPTEENIEAGIRQSNLEGVPAVEFGAAQDFLDRLSEKRESLPLWVGELYLEKHRGTYTTQAFNKKMNRRIELRLRELEMLWSSIPLRDYPGDQLKAMWKILLLNQFHDIIPGSSITPVYSESREQYEELSREAESLTISAGRTLFKQKTDCICLVNTLSYRYENPVLLPESWGGFDVLDEEGIPVPQQLEEGGGPVVSVEIPPLGSRTLKRGKNGRSPEPIDPTLGLVLENDLIRYEFTESGTLKRAYDKFLKRDVMPDGQKGNLLCLFEDRPNEWDAWDIDIFYENQLREKAVLVSWERIADGPVRQGLGLQKTIGRSKIYQKAFLPSGSLRLDFETRVEWKEDHKLLRVYFPVDVKSDSASFEIQFGFVRRPTHRNTSWDRARFEVVGHRFADLSDRDCGAALLNDCKYGYSAVDNVLGMSLLRAPSQPDPSADRGSHEFTYSFFPHESELIFSPVFSEAAQLNQKPFLFHGLDGRDFKFPFGLDSDQIVLDTVKRAENEEAVILRLFEPRGKRASVVLALDFDIAEVSETDLMETELNQLDCQDGTLFLDFSPFEIKTIKILLK